MGGMEGGKFSSYLVKGVGCVCGRLFAPFTSLLCLLNEGAMTILYGFVIKPRTDVCCVTPCPFLRGIVCVY